MWWDLATWFNFACWIVCFWWMHSLSRRQEAMLERLHDQTRRIAQIAGEEKTILKEVHPAVEEIHEELKDVHESVKAQRRGSRPG